MNGTEAVTAKLEAVGGAADATVAKVKGLLAVVRSARVAIGDCELAVAETVKNGAVVVTDVVQHSTLTGTDGDAEAPLLPLDQAVGMDLEGGTFGLNDIKRLEVVADGDVEQFRNVLGGYRLGKERLGLVSAGRGLKAIVCAAGGEAVDADKLLCDPVHDGDEGDGVGVVVCVGVALAGVSGKDEALHVLGGIAFAVVNATIWPGVDAVLEALWQCELFQCLLEGIFSQDHVLELGKLATIRYIVSSRDKVLL